MTRDEVLYSPPTILVDTVVLGGSAVKTRPSFSQLNRGRGNPLAVHVMVTPSLTTEYSGKFACVMTGGSKVGVIYVANSSIISQSHRAMLTKDS